MTPSMPISRHGPRLVTRRESGDCLRMNMDASPAARRMIGARLKRLREFLGYKTQTSFAESVGLQRHRYVQYETGERLLTIDAAAAIRAKTNCPIDFLYFGDIHGLPASLRDLGLPDAA